MNICARLTDYQYAPASRHHQRARTGHFVHHGAPLEQQVVSRAHARQIEQAEDAVDRARQLYEMAGFNHQRVSADLLQRYEEAIARRDEVKAAHARALPEPTVTVTAADSAEVLALMARVDHLWKAPTTTNEDRKRLLRTVIREIVVHIATEERIEFEIVWAGGLRQRRHALRPKGIDLLVNQLHGQGLDPEAIAEHLRAEGLESAKNTPIQRHMVYGALKRTGQSLTDLRREARLRIRQMLIDNRTRPEILAILQNEAPAALGRWTRARLDQTVAQLFRGAPGVPPLPNSLRPTKRSKLSPI